MEGLILVCLEGGGAREGKSVGGAAIRAGYILFLLGGKTARSGRLEKISPKSTRGEEDDDRSVEKPQVTE